MPFQPASDILSSVKVLDLTRVRSGPTCIRQLADWGADVVKIEDPETKRSGLAARARVPISRICIATSVRSR